MRTLSLLVVAAPLLIVQPRSSPALDNSHSVDDILAPYVKQLGGMDAIDKIKTREVEAHRHHGLKIIYYWEKPNKVLQESNGSRIGYNGSSGWMLSRKKHVNKLPKGSQEPLEIDANPTRYAHLKDLYSEINVGPAETVDDTKMDVLVAPNDLGATKFYFDSGTHLLTRIEETGVTSAYFKHTIDFMDYKDVDGVKFPFRIVHRTTEPGMDPDDIRISKVEPNVDLDPQMFDKPTVGSVIFGGKR